MKNVQKTHTALAIFALGTLVAGSLLPSQAQARQGGESSGGGDGIYVEGRLVLRDFLDNAQMLADNVAFLKSINGFENLLRDIAQVHPAFAAAIWKDLKYSKIFVLDDELTLLPKESTGVSKKVVPEEQIAIREGNNIIFSLPALARLGDQKPYLLLHEALHGLMASSGALHHVKVRTLVSYIKNERATLKREALETLLQKLNVRMMPYRSFLNVSAEDIFETGRVVMAGLGSFEARCAIVQDLVVNNTYDVYRLQGVEDFGEYSNCPKVEAFSLLYKTFPGLKSLLGAEQFVYTPGRLFTDRRMRDNTFAHCNNYVTREHWNLIQSQKSIEARSIKMRSTLMSYKNPRDPALETYVRSLVKENGSETRFGLPGAASNLSMRWARSDTSTNLDKIIQDFQANERICAGLFKGSSQQGWSKR